MKIGLSYSRCVRDLVEGEVQYDDVLVIIARTDFDPHDDQQWKSIWQGYGGGTDTSTMRGLFGGVAPEWAGYIDEDENRFRSISCMLFDDGKLHQPRKFGARPVRRNEYWLEAVLPDSELLRNPVVKEAWDRFLTVAGLVSKRPDQIMTRDYQ